MAYYLKKTKLKGRTYLSIDESFIVMKRKAQPIGVLNLWDLLKPMWQRGLKIRSLIFKKKLMNLTKPIRKMGLKKYQRHLRFFILVISL